LLIILDSHGILYRSYFALRDGFAGATRTTGEPTWAVYGYANSLLHVLDELRPTHIMAAWDGPGPTFRHDADVNYKATRPPMPDDLRPQVARVREMLEAFRIPVIEAPGFEADDVLGTLSAQAAEQGVETIIVTLDNDSVQLVGPRVKVYMYRPYQRDYVLYDEEAVRERWGFEPLQIIDYKALVGDTSDNISGVRGIGEKGAKALIQQWGSVEAMLGHLDEVTPPRVRAALTEGQEAARHSKQMATIIRDVPGVTLDLSIAQVHDYDREAVLAIFQELEFKSLISRLPPQPSDESLGRAAAADDTPAAAYTVVADAAALAEAVAAIQTAGRFAFELVADDEHPMRAAERLVGIGLSTAAGAGWYVPFGHGAPAQPGQQAMDFGAIEGAPVQLGQAEVLAALAPVLTSPTIERVAHNAKFAMVALAEAKGGYEPGPVVFDTMIAAYVLGNSNIAIAGLAFDRLGYELIDPKQLLGTGRAAIPFSSTTPEACAPYAAGNADLALRLADVLTEELRDSGVEQVFHEIDVPHAPVLARVERWGLALDVEVLRGLDGDLAARIATCERAIYAAVGHEFQIGSPQQLSSILFEELGLPKTRKTTTGWTTDADALEPLRLVHPVVELILEWRELTKIKSTYIDTLPRQVNARTGRVHTVFSQVTAATGRLASNAPNLQNIPVRTELGQAVRRAFIARDCGDDPVLMSFDYSQIELRVLAHVCDDAELKRAFLEGQDIHAATASRVFSVDRSGITPEMRRRAKVFNFGVLYGLTGFGLSQREGIPRDEADAFIEAYFAAYPSVQAWREQVVAEARERGYAETLTGRRRYIPGLRAANFNQRQGAERIAINMPIQGAAADIIKIAMNQIDAELRDRQRDGLRARMVLQVHDELIFETPREEMAAVREIALRLMPSIELSVPLVIDEKSGRSWGEME